MSTSLPPQNSAVPMVPEGTEVASYRTYPEASQAVDYLSQNDFNVSQVTIVGTDLYLVERVTGRLTAGRVAMSSASSGGIWGAMLGFVFSINSGTTSSLWILGGMFLGALAAMSLSLIAFVIRGRRRDFLSQQQVVAARYAVLVSSAGGREQLDRAFELLQKTPGNQMRPRRRPQRREETNGPTEYGSRPDEKPRFGVRLSDEASAASVDSRSSDSAPSGEGEN